MKQPENNGLVEAYSGKPQDPRYQNLRAESYSKLVELINARKLRIIRTDEQREHIMDELGALRI